MATNRPPSTEVAHVTEDQIQVFVTSMLVPRKGTFGRLLPEGIDEDAFVGLAAAALYKAPKTAEVAMRQPESLYVAMREAAGMGLMPGTEEYYLTVRRPEAGGAQQILGIVGYQGHIKRMYQFGTVISIHYDVVCQGEQLIRRDPEPPRHIYKRPRDKSVDNLVGAYAYAMLASPNGPVCSRVIDMDRPEIMQHREKAGTTKIWDGPFGFEQWQKTCLHKLEKAVPKSSAYQEREMAQQLRVAEVEQAEPIRVQASAGEPVAADLPKDDREWDDVTTAKPGGTQ